MRKWVIWAVVVLGALALFHYDYLWRMQFVYWVNVQAGKVLRFILD